MPLVEFDKFRSMLAVDLVTYTDAETHDEELMNVAVKAFINRWVDEKPTSDIKDLIFQMASMMHPE